MAISEYPAILTDKDWQAKKGKLAELASGTGIGELMKKCAEAHGKIDWTQKYDLALRMRVELERFDLAMSKDDIVNILEKEAGQQYLVDAAPVRKLVAEVRDRAKEVAKEWKKKPLIPSSSCKHVQSVADAAELFYLEMKENSDSYKLLLGGAKVRETLTKKKEEAIKALDKQIELCETGLKAALHNPTKKGWIADGAHQGCRSVNNSVVAIPELKKLFASTWNKFGDNYADDIPDNDPQEGAKIKEKIKTVFQELIKFKAAAHKMLNS